MSAERRQRATEPRRLPGGPMLVRAPERAFAPAQRATPGPFALDLHPAPADA